MVDPERVLQVRRCHALDELEPLWARLHDDEATPELLDRLAVERARIDQHIDDLTTARNRLDAVMTAAGQNLRTGEHCRN